MVDGVQDFRAEFPLVDPKTGLATPEFLRFLQQRGGNVLGAIDDASDAFSLATQIQNTEIIAGAGLTGGGDLSQDRTLSIDTTAEAERIRDVIGAALVAGSNVTITVNDVADTITIASSGSGSSSTYWVTSLYYALGMTSSASGSFAGNPILSMKTIAVNNFFWSTSAGSQTLTFDAGTGNSYVVQGFRIFQSNTTAQGTWSFQGSNDASSWTNLDTGWSWAPISLNSDSVLERTFSNSTAYRYYRFTKTAGSTNSNPFVNWFHFKIAF